MLTRSNMVVPLRELPTHLDIELPNAFVREALHGMPMRAALDRPEDDPQAGAAEAHLDLYSEDENVFVRGRLEGWMDVACSRCLGTARVQVKERLEISYLPASQMPGDEPASHPKGAEDGVDGRGSGEELGVELSDDDLDLYGYEGEEIDLEPMLREQLVLAVPLAPHCIEACKGLCPQCGADWNQQACGCEPPLDPRWGALKNIKI